MKNATIITLILLLIGCFGVGIDADGGLFNRKKCPPNIRKPDMVPFPIDEIPIVDNEGAPTCTDKPAEALSLRLSRLETLISTIASSQQINVDVRRDTPLPEKDPDTGSDTSVLSDITRSGMPWGTLLAAAGGGAGLGLPLMGLLLWRARKATKGKRKPKVIYSDGLGLILDRLNEIVSGQGQGGLPPLPGTRTVVTDAPPLPGTHTTSTEFINCESDHYQRAHEMARGHVARRYPGSQEILEAELHLTKQFAAGLPS